MNILSCETPVWASSHALIAAALVSIITACVAARVKAEREWAAEIADLRDLNERTSFDDLYD